METQTAPKGLRPTRSDDMPTDDDVKANIAANVKASRTSQKKSQYWLAAACGAYPIHICRIESGDTMPNAGTLVRLAVALGVSTDKLLAKRRK